MIDCTAEKIEKQDSMRAVQDKGGLCETRWVVPDKDGVGARQEGVWETTWPRETRGGCVRLCSCVRKQICNKRDL